MYFRKNCGLSELMPLKNGTFIEKEKFGSFYQANHDGKQVKIRNSVNISLSYLVACRVEILLLKKEILEIEIRN